MLKAGVLPGGQLGFKRLWDTLLGMQKGSGTTDLEAASAAPDNEKRWPQKQETVPVPFLPRK